MSTPGNTAKLGTVHNNIRYCKVVRTWFGSNLQCISQHTTESAHEPIMPARHELQILKFKDARKEGCM